MGGTFQDLLCARVCPCAIWRRALPFLAVPRELGQLSHSAPDSRSFDTLAMLENAGWLSSPASFRGLQSLPLVCPSGSSVPLPRLLL